MNRDFLSWLFGLGAMSDMRCKGEPIAHSVVDPACLKTLSTSALAELVKLDELELICAHLVSMQNFATVRDRLVGRLARSGNGTGQAAVAS
jgi:hypothetical protein